MLGTEQGRERRILLAKPYQDREPYELSENLVEDPTLPFAGLSESGFLRHIKHPA